MKNIMKTFIKYVSMNIIGMLGISFYILADTFFIARGVGPDGLTALNLAIPVYSLFHGIGLMIGMGGATRYSLALGLGNETRRQGVFPPAWCCFSRPSLPFWVWSRQNRWPSCSGPMGTPWG